MGNATWLILHIPSMLSRSHKNMTALNLCDLVYSSLPAESLSFHIVVELCPMCLAVPGLHTAMMHRKRQKAIDAAVNQSSYASVPSSEQGCPQLRDDAERTDGEARAMQGSEIFRDFPVPMRPSELWMQLTASFPPRPSSGLRRPEGEGQLQVL